MLNLSAPNRHISSDLANELMGEYHLPADHEARVFAIEALIKYYRMVRDLGDLEHTGDWDWRIAVVMTDGRLIGTHDWDEVRGIDVWGDEMKIPFTVDPADYTDHFARWTSLQIEENTFSEDGIVSEAIITVPIDDIQTITITTA